MNSKTFCGSSVTFLLFSSLLTFGVGGLSKNDGQSTISDKETIINVQLECNEGEPSCKTDKLSLQAIKELHRMMDDDRDGSVDKKESDEFISEEMKDTGESETAAIFQSNESVIAVEGMWNAWLKSDVYNWTVDEVVHWLEYHVHLPQYSAIFKSNNINGRSIPRLSTTKGTALKKELGISNRIHRKKIAFMAMQLVVFGPPKEGTHIMKIIVPLATVFTLFVVGVSWFAFSQNKKSKTQLERMLTEMESLQKDVLKDVQKKSNKDIAHSDDDKRNKKDKTCLTEITAAKKEAERLKAAREESNEELNRLKLAEEELVQVRQALKQAESELERTQWVTSNALKNLLQVTYDKELAYFNKFKYEAGEQFRLVREECERLSRKGVGFLGALRVVGSMNNNTIHEIDRQILAARSALEEVESYKNERLKRWKNIEQICGYTLSINRGGVKTTRPLTSHLSSKSLDRATGEFGSSGSLPRSWTPSMDHQRRFSNDSNLTDDMSNESILPDDSVTEGANFSLERFSRTDTVTDPSSQGQDLQLYQTKHIPQMRSVKKQNSDDVMVLHRRKRPQQWNNGKRSNSDINLRKRSQSDLHLDKLNYSGSFTYGQHAKESHPENKTKKKFKLMEKISHSFSRLLR